MGGSTPVPLNSRRFCGSTLCILFPLNVHPGQAVFVETVFKAAMQTAGTYDAAGNLFWINFKWSAAPKVPINRDSVKRLQSKIFKDGPALFDRPTVIAVAEDISVSKGNLRRVSPEEPEHAYLFALKDAITNGESEDVLLQLVRVK